MRMCFLVAAYTTAIHCTSARLFCRCAVCAAEHILQEQAGAAGAGAGGAATLGCAPTRHHVSREPQ
jgi:hypothetical protein